MSLSLCSKKIKMLSFTTLRSVTDPLIAVGLTAALTC